MALGCDAENDASPRLTSWQPTLRDIVEANRAILDAYGHPERHALRDRGFITHALDDARNRCDRQPGPLGVIDASAHVAHAIARAQAFLDANHRTGHLVCQTFLYNNGLGRLSPLGFDDDELAEHLEGTGIKFQPALFGPQDTADLLLLRHTISRN